MHCEVHGHMGGSRVGELPQGEKQEPTGICSPEWHRSPLGPRCWRGLGTFQERYFKAWGALSIRPRTVAPFALVWRCEGYTALKTEIVTLLLRPLIEHPTTLTTYNFYTSFLFPLLFFSITSDTFSPAWLHTPWGQRFLSILFDLTVLASRIGFRK